MSRNCEKSTVENRCEPRRGEAAAAVPMTARKPVTVTVPWSGRGCIYTEEEVATVADAMRTADPQTQGKYQVEFERAFAAYTGAAYAFAVTSCTAALELAARLWVSGASAFTLTRTSRRSVKAACLRLLHLSGQRWFPGCVTTVCVLTRRSASATGSRL